jgi:hypothetical protein
MGNSRPQAKASLFIEVREDKRTNTQKADGTYAVKGRLWDSSTKARRLHQTGTEMSKAAFETAMKPRPKAAAQTNKALLNAALAKFTNAFEEIAHFDFKELDTKVGTPKDAKTSVFWQYEQRIAQLKKSEQLSSAEGYGLAAKALRKYCGRDKV